MRWGGVRGLVVACLLACGTSTLDADLDDLRQRTVPAGATLVVAAPPNRRTWGVEATWEVETTLRWEDYLEQVRLRLTGFAPRGAGVFTRTLQGDTQTLRFETAGTGSPLRVRVRLTASAS